MRPLRQKLKALSPAIILVSVLCGIISAQSGLTTIQDTLFDADGARYNGTLTIQWSTFDTTNPGTILRQSKTVQVVNGNLLLQLSPNNTATPPANIYNVLYESDGDQQYSETWAVPVSANALTVAQVRTGGGVGNSGGGSAGGLTGGTGTTEASITNLVSDLNARPIKGPGFGTNAVAVIDQNGQIETAVGNLGDCVFVDGTTGPCAAGITLPTFINGETPSGVVNGLNPTFTLANTPSGASLLLFRNGLLAQTGVDYTLNGSTITFTTQAIPQPLDTLLAGYRIDPGSTVPGSGVATGPSGSPGLNGCGAVNAVSKNAAYQIVPADNGTLFIQTANAGFSLPVTPPAAGWCVALLNTGGSNVSIGNSGNHINGASAAYPLQPANSVLVLSDGSGYWVTGGTGMNGTSGTNGTPGAQGPAGPAGSSGVAPSGTGAVQVTSGVAGLVSGSATNCVLVNGTSATCGGAPGGANGQIQYNNAGVFAGFTPAVNGAAISTPSTLNFLNSAAFNGLTLSFSNPATGNVQLGASGTLNNSGLTNSSFTAAMPSWLTGTSPVSLGGTLTVSAATGQASHQVIGTCGTATSFGPCALVAADLPALTQINNVAYPASPSTNTVPVVTAANTVTYEAVPVAALASSSITVNGTTCSLGNTCTVSTTMTAPSLWSRYAVIYGSSAFSVISISSALTASSDQNDIEPCSGYSASVAHTYNVAYDSTTTFKWNLDGGAYTTGVAIAGSNTCQTLSNGFRISFGHASGYIAGDSNTFALATPTATAGALTQDVTLVTPPAKSVVEGIVMYQPSGFAGSGITTLTFSVGRSGTEMDFAQPQCLVSGTCGTVLGASTGPIYSGGGANVLNMASQSIVGQFTAAGANLSAVSAGVLDLWMKTEVLP